MNRVLVTGGAGFLGSHVCAELMKSPDHFVTVLDDLSTGKQANIDFIVKNPSYNSSYEFIKGDVKDLDTCMKACESVDYVMNEAAWGSVPRSIEMPLFYSLNNIQGTLNMLEAASSCSQNLDGHILHACSQLRYNYGIQLFMYNLYFEGSAVSL